ncbi:cell division protein FtsI (penicillin-binding protein 3) [Methylopila capsulata]|uniref:Penicillin-binding protein n=1 Tax=Methylopila capsulata TaxID=61654 RepID=A0A9W6IST1_9HYPH|nr:penicillin-binding protein 2 [Methylopila capsulata]MBM7850582.1 cell division protein FtsI (penicillin-binding protein 3) [Methylopila capsulata]GLK55877.1 penicillin-binding protein [Methylopila capsulata]
MNRDAFLSAVARGGGASARAVGRAAVTSGRWAVFGLRGLFRLLKKLFFLLVGRGEGLGLTNGRLRIAMLAFGIVYLTIVGRMVQYAVAPDVGAVAKASQQVAAISRPDIVDRNGQVLATDIKVSSLYAEPKNIIDVDEAVELLSGALPELNRDELRARLSTKKGFVWLKREVTPREQVAVFRLGIPGVGFIQENKRIYPNGDIVAHILGFADVDNKGIAGIEKYLDTSGMTAKAAAIAADGGRMEPIHLALDLKVQHAVRDELSAGMKKFKAIAGSAAIADVETGEIVSLVSLPDYDPNNPVDALKPDRINRVNVGVFEMGSTMKALTIAMGLDSGKFNLQSRMDARAPLQYGRFRIHDFHPTNRVLTIPEVFVHSSNIGTARIALGMGVEAHKAFLAKMRQLNRLQTELPESARPILPPRWGELNTITISFGHGLAIAPIQSVMAVSALVNGGYLMTPTFMQRTAAEARSASVQVLKPSTSVAMRYLMRLNAEKGSAKKADIPGYRVGGKTGTAEKVVNGRYAKNKNLTAFTAVFPMDKPKYMMLVVLDEPQALPETHGFATSGWNVVPVGGKMVERIAPLLGVEPIYDAPPAQDLLASIGATVGAVR